jgi:Gram-negative bacterial TonB protein C-terminal
MLIRNGSSLIALVWCSVATPAFSAPLQPTGQWSVNYGATQCVATRPYGTASGAVTLSIVPSVSGGTYVLQVGEQEAGPTFAQEFNGTVDFGTGGITTRALYFGANGAQMRAHQFRIPAAQMDYARSASGVSLSETKGATFEFALSDMGAVLDALRTCTAALQRDWNVGATAAREVKPVGDVRAIFTTNDLPAEAMQRQQPEKAQYQLLVDEQGAVVGCDILEPSGSALIDTEGCQLVRERARFKPAMDALGKAVRSVWTSPRITWRTNQEAFDNGCRSVAGSGAGVDMCGQSRTAEEDLLRRAPPPQPSTPTGRPPRR